MKEGYVWRQNAEGRKEGRKEGVSSLPGFCLSLLFSLSLPTAAAADDDDEGSSNRRSARQFVTEGNDDGAATILRPFGGLSRVASMEQPCETNDGR